jgi:hypothetical protein
VPPSWRTAAAGPRPARRADPRALVHLGQSRRLVQAPGDAQLAEQIGGAAGRALDEARQAIAALTRPADQAFGLSFQQAVEDLGRRYDIRTTTEIEPSVVVTPEQAEAVCGSPLRRCATPSGTAGLGLCAWP